MILHSGKIHVVLRKVLALVRAKPRSTALELAAMSDMLDRYQVGHRLIQLERGGEVMRCGRRACRITRRTATIWMVQGQRSKVEDRRVEKESAGD